MNKSQDTFARLAARQKQKNNTGLKVKHTFYKIAKEEWTPVDKVIDEYLCECYERNKRKIWKPLTKSYLKVCM